MREWKTFDVITKGEGMWLIDSKGNRLLDGVASMWCNVWGHSKKELVNAMISQTKKLQHSSLFNLTNDKAEILAEKLVSISPGMKKVFYSDDGSTAMEIAAKMAIQYWQNIRIKNKTKFVSLENGYHGDTVGAMSIGYVPFFFSKFKKLLFPVIRTPTPHKYRIDEIKNLSLVGDVRHKGMLMGIELVSDKKKKTPIKPEKSIPKKIFAEAKRHKIYLRTLGHIVMLVPPLAISTNELDFLLDGTIDTIKKVTKK